jgi:hypothetical protein
MIHLSHYWCSRIDHSQLFAIRVVMISNYQPLLVAPPLLSSDNFLIPDMFSISCCTSFDVFLTDATY